MARFRTLASALASTACIVAYATPAEAQPRPFNIPAARLKDALRAFVAQSGMQLIYREEGLGTARSRPVEGSYEPAEALRRILEGSGFKSVSDASGAQAIVQEGKVGNVSVAVTAATETASSKGKDAAGSAPANQAGADSQAIIVTAQKRNERLQDVPVPVTAVAASTLVEHNQVRLQDYFSRIPGLNLTTGNRGEPLISIRGISLTVNPTVGITVDDVPFGPTLGSAGGFLAPDIDPNELSRIEVLRGPQGTYYGVSSLSGLIKYITVEPSIAGVSGHLQAGISGVENGHEVGYTMQAAINVPLSNTLAVRASGFTRSSPGYIDDPFINERGVNSARAAGGHFALLWNPSEGFTVKLSALLQRRDTDGSNLIYREPGLGDLQQDYLKDSGWLKTRVQAYSATLTKKFGDLTLTSLTGYNVYRIRSSVDLPFLSGLADALFGVTGAPFVDNFQTTKVTQEVRATTPIGRSLDLLVGGFYTHESFRTLPDIQATDANTGEVVGHIIRIDGVGHYEEYAVFGDLTVKFTDRFDVQVGGRQSHNRQDYFETLNGAVSVPKIRESESPFTYLLTPRLRISPNLMIYARFASGYRAGGVNGSSATGATIPPAYKSDKTYNYEIGVKGGVLDRALTFDASVFYIDWKDLQLSFIDRGSGYTSNGSSATSKGVELSVTLRPWRGMSVFGSAAYTDATVAQDFGILSAVRAVKGDRLPYTSKFAGSLSLDQDFPVTPDWRGFVGATASYVGRRLGAFRATPLRQVYPAFTQIDLHAGVASGDWKANAFVTNVTDRRGLLSGGLGGIDPRAFDIIQPRTFGLSLSKSF